MITIINKSENDIAYQTSDSVGFDICSNEARCIKTGETVMINTGLFIDVEQSQKDCYNFTKRFRELFYGVEVGVELQLRPRSSLAKKGLELVNTPATVEIDYPDEIKVLLKNTTNHLWEIHKGQRIVQGVVSLVFEANVSRKNVVRTGGFGSTGDD